MNPSWAWNLFLKAHTDSWGMNGRFRIEFCLEGERRFPR